MNSVNVYPPQQSCILTKQL